MDHLSGLPVSRRGVLRLAFGALGASVVIRFPFGLRSLTAAAPPLPQTSGAPAIPLASVIDPNQLVDLLSHSGAKPAVICVGFKFLYDSAHIPGALYLGPGREGNGIVALAKWAGNAPRDKAMVIYCGCCPWAQCPNILPAYTALQKLGMAHVKVLRIDQNFGADWVNKGLPTERPKQK
jgi:hypothetical protein